MADLSKLRIGSSGSASALVNEQRLATSVGSGDAPVFASPMLVALMEAAAVDCVEAQLPDGHQSLGTHLDVTHSSPTPIGFTVTATATLASIDGRKLTFKVVANDGVEQIGSGEHTRVVVDTAVSWLALPPNRCHGNERILWRLGRRPREVCSLAFFRREQSEHRTLCEL